jgi:hypothetical protein
VVSVALPDSYHAALIVQRDDGLWDVRVVLASGEIDAQTAIPGVGAPVLMLPGGGFVYGDGNGTVLRKPDGSERHIRTPLPAAFEFEQMGRDWIQVRDLAGGSQFAVRVTESREQSYQLPEVAQ